MAFRDTPFAPHRSSFVGHGDVREYLQLFSEKHSLLKYVRLNTPVHGVVPKFDASSSSLPPRWLVDHAGGRSEYDAVVVCNGHYSLPRIPSFHGQTGFPGRIMHSKWYREPSSFYGQHVIVVGAGSSGVDIARELAAPATAAASVTLLSRDNKFGGTTTTSSDATSSHTGARGVPLAPRLAARGSTSVERLWPDGSVQLTDGTRLPRVDSIVCATGYDHHFPFLPGCGPAQHEAEEEGGGATGDGCSAAAAAWGGSATANGPCNPCLRTSGVDAGGGSDSDGGGNSHPLLCNGALVCTCHGFVHPLYHHTFHTRWPSLAFVGLPTLVAPFRMFEDQAIWVARVLSGAVSLPPYRRRLSALRQQYAAHEQSGVPLRHSHHMGPAQWDFRRLLHAMAFPDCPVTAAPASGETANSLSSRNLFPPPRHAPALPSYVLGRDGCPGANPATGLCPTSTLHLWQSIYEDTQRSRTRAPDTYRERSVVVDSGETSFSWVESKQCH